MDGKLSTVTTLRSRFVAPDQPIETDEIFQGNPRPGKKFTPTGKPKVDQITSTPRSVLRISKVVFVPIPTTREMSSHRDVHLHGYQLRHQVRQRSTSTCREGRQGSSCGRHQGCRRLICDHVRV